MLMPIPCFLVQIVDPMLGGIPIAEKGLVKMSEWKKQPTEKLDDDQLEQVSGGMDELPADRFGV